MRQKLILLCIIALSSLFMGCSLQTTTPPMAKYRLEVTLPKALPTKAPLHEKVVRLAQIESSAMLNGRVIAYEADNGQSYSYTKARWMESINRQVTNLMLRSLTESGVFKDVIEYRSKAKNDYLLETNIYEFSQTVHDDGSSEVHLMVKVRLIEQYSRKIVKNRIFEYRKKGLEGNVQGAVEGYSALMQAYLQELNRWLGKE